MVCLQLAVATFAATHLLAATHAVVAPAGGSTADVGSGGSGRQKLLALQQRSTQEQPHETRHYLNKKQLESIDSVWCLQQKQENPFAPCKKHVSDKGFTGDLSIGHFPHWRYNQADCHSNYEFFCDPNDLMTTPQQYAVSKSLHAFKTTTLVNCGLYADKMDPHRHRDWWEKKNPSFHRRVGLEDYREFNLAVIVVNDFPESELDASSMQIFGRYIMAKWGLQAFYNGVDNGNSVNQVYHWDEYYSNCPTATILFIFPKYNQAYLHSPSCEFICHTRGGQEVEAATLKALETRGIDAAIEEGVKEAKRVLDVTIPRSLEEGPVVKNWRLKMEDSMMASDTTWIWTMRFYGIGMLVFFAFAVGSFVYFQFFVPNKDRRMSALSASRKETTEAISTHWDEEPEWERMQFVQSGPRLPY